MSNRKYEVQLRIDLKPVVKQDDTGLFTAWFELFPETNSIGKTRKEAQREALKILVSIQTNHKKRFEKILVEEYYKKQLLKQENN